MNNPISSYLRHWLTLQLSKFALQIDLPVAGLESVIAYLVEGAVLLALWAVTKYVIPLLNDKTVAETIKIFSGKFRGHGDGGAASLFCMMFIGVAVLSLSLSLSSCGGVSGGCYLRDEATGAKGGLRVETGSPPAAWFRLPVPAAGQVPAANQ